MKKNKDDSYLSAEADLVFAWRKAGPKKRRELLDSFHRRISFLQHERLVHVLVTLFFGGASLFSGWVVLISISLYFPILFLVLLAVTVFYVVHYYRLENACQRWQNLAIELEKELLSVKK
jgi:hypothetical protein